MCSIEDFRDPCDLDDSALFVLPKLSLPNLRHLKLEDGLQSLVHLIDILPDPRESFYVNTELSPTDQMWTSNSRPHGVIVSRLAKFWSDIMGDHILPAGTLIHHITERLTFDEVSFGTEDAAGDASTLFYSSACLNSAVDEPILQQTETIHFSRGTLVDPQPGHVDLQWLCRVHTLVLTDVSASGDAESEVLEK